MADKILLFGGSFDPIHNGHIEVAKSSLKQLDAKKLIFIPAKCSPLKEKSPIASEKNRFEMIRMSIKGVPFFEVSDCEFSRPSPSYSYETVKFFWEQYKSKLIWLIGADAVLDLARWYRVKEIFSMCDFAIMKRGSYPMPDIDSLESEFGKEIVSRLKDNLVNTPEVSISSTEVRKSIREGLNASGMLNKDVEDYIIRNGVYN